jgi:hypothetical protein
MVKSLILLVGICINIDSSDKNSTTSIKVHDPFFPRVTPS